MARIPQCLLLFSSQTITTAGVLSDIFSLGRDAYASVHYTLATSTTSPAVAATAQILVSASERETYLIPVDTAGGVGGTLCQINSNNQFIRTALPLAVTGKVRLIASNNSSLIVSAFYLILDEAN